MKYLFPNPISAVRTFPPKPTSTITRFGNSIASSTRIQRSQGRSSPRWARCVRSITRLPRGRSSIIVRWTSTSRRRS